MTTPEQKSWTPGGRPLWAVLLVAYLAALAGLTLRPTRTLFEVRNGYLQSRTGDWSLFLLDREASWDGAGTLRLCSRMRATEESTCVGFTVALSGGPGRERALLFCNQTPDREFRARVHGEDADLTPRGEIRVVKAVPGKFHACEVEVSARGGRYLVAASVDGTPVGTWSCDGGPFVPPLRFGIWCSRFGLREFEDLRVERIAADEGRTVLADVRFDRRESLDRFVPRVGYTPSPFSFDQVPFFPNPLRGTRALSEDLFDVAGNLAMFLPAGFLLVRLLRGRVMRAVLAAATLSLAIELLQQWVPTRVTSLFDLGCNTLGAWIGAFVGAHVWRGSAP